MTNGDHQNNISDLPNLGKYRMENLFKVYKGDDGNYFYNLLNTIIFPENLDETVYYTWNIPTPNMPWTLISYKAYGTIELWWLICSANNINNPIYSPQAGNRIRIIKKEYVADILQQIGNLK